MIRAEDSNTTFIYSHYLTCELRANIEKRGKLFKQERIPNQRSGTSFICWGVNRFLQIGGYSGDTDPPFRSY